MDPTKEKDYIHALMEIPSDSVLIYFYFFSSLMASDTVFL